MEIFIIYLYLGLNFFFIIWNIFIADGSVHIAGQDLNIFHDTSHLLKGLRNNFLTKNILWDKKLRRGNIWSLFMIHNSTAEINSPHVDPKKNFKNECVRSSLGTKCPSCCYAQIYQCAK